MIKTAIIISRKISHRITTIRLMCTPTMDIVNTEILGLNTNSMKKKITLIQFKAYNTARKALKHNHQLEI